MQGNTIVFALFLIFAGAAVFSTLALYTRQSLLVAYMLLGILLGPWGLQWVPTTQFVEQTGDVGIIFLLFLLGLHLHPQNLLHLFKKTMWVAIVSTIVFGVVGFGISDYFGFTLIESFIIAIAMTFSSTIIGVKLLPTTVLHHQHIGEIMISILLMQDLIAIVALLVIHGFSEGNINIWSWVKIIVALPSLLLVSFILMRYLLIKLFSRFDRIREYMFLLAIAWCLGMSVLATLFGLSYEIGAFIGGVSIASSSIALYIAESLKPLRDFFLVMFFFSVGASFNLQYFNVIIIPAIVLAMIMIGIKPMVFHVLLRQVGESKKVATEIGIRLGQVSEFSLLVGYLAFAGGLIDAPASYLIQAATILTFIASSYLVVLRYPTPMAISDKLRRD